jgi:threonyl-tRNA synthetase
MKLLILNSKSFGYTLHHKTPVAEDVSEESVRGEFENPLVVFIAVEAKDTDGMVNEVGEDIRKIAVQNKTDLILLNPFAHLSSRLARPAQAIELLDKLAEYLRQYAELKTERLTFGWYKEFSLDVKGEDNSQIFREY